MPFEIKLLALPLQASAFLGHIERGVPKDWADQFAGLSVKRPNDERPPCYALALADAAGLPVRLEYLKWNPVGALYRRNGFRPIGETGIHVLLERPPASGA
jgi:hypothetical protein